MPTLEEVLHAYGQIPDLENFNRYMFVGPHPDDIEFGCGALISKLKELNKEVTYVIATDGAAGTMDPKVTPEMMAKTRKEETLKAASFMNVKNVEFLGLEDGGDFEVKDVIKALAPVILKYNPEIIFAPDSRLKTECHGDHIKVGEAVRRLGQIVPHPVALSRQGVNIENVTEFPNNITFAFYFTDDSNKKVEVSEANLNDKIQSLLCHTSQMQDSSTELLLNYFKLKALKLGANTSTGLAEDYQVIVPLMQHVYAEGIHINEN